MIKFNKYNVTDTESKIKARVFYSIDGRVDGRKCVTLVAKGYNRDLRKIFPTDYKNDSDIMTDYFAEDRVNLFENHPLYLNAMGVKGE